MSLIKNLILKISPIIFTYLFIKRALNATDFSIKTFSLFMAILGGLLSVYIIFENKIKEYSICKNYDDQFGILLKKIPLKYHYYKYSPLDLICITLGCYFVTFVFIYASVTNNNHFLIWWLSRYLFYFICLIFVSGTIYFSIQLLLMLKNIKNKKNQPDKK